MRVVLTCGGTGGHINPAISVAKVLKSRMPDTEILFVGSDGMEKDLVPREGFRLEQLVISSFHRSIRPKEIVHNIKSVARIRNALKKADRIIDEFKPDVILGTGGYASYPMLNQGAKRGIPTAVHEANAVPGLATKLVADKVDKILVCFEESKTGYKHSDRVITVGMPVKVEFSSIDKESAKKELGLVGKPLVVSAWGSLGAREMNKKIADFMKFEVQDDAWYHVHATGSYGWKWMPEYVREQGLNLEEHPNIQMKEYIYNMPTLIAAADVVLSRAGSSSLNEIAASGTPCIIIPSPNVTNNHQEKNARILADRGAAVMLLENETDGEKLFLETKKLIENQEKCEEMSKTLKHMAVIDSAEKICDIITQMAAK